MSPLPKIPQQGDAQRLAQVASGLKREGGTYGAVVQRNPTGRPQGSTGTPAPRASKQPQVQIPPEHQQLMSELAQAEATRQDWAAMAAQSPTPWVQGMLQVADENYNRLAEQVYAIIPNQGF